MISDLTNVFESNYTKFYVIKQESMKKMDAEWANEPECENRFLFVKQTILEILAKLKMNLDFKLTIIKHLNVNRHRKIN